MRGTFPVGGSHPINLQKYSCDILAGLILILQTPMEFTEFFQSAFADKRMPYTCQVRLADGDAGTDFLTAKHANYANELRGSGEQRILSVSSRHG